MIERKIDNQLTFKGGVVVVKHRWRALDENHDTVEREWPEFVLPKDMPKDILYLGEWYEDNGGLLSDA